MYASSGDGNSVTLNGNREFQGFLYGSRFVQLDFLEGPGICPNCFRTWERFVISQPNTYGPNPFRVTMQTNVVDSANVEVANGLMNLIVNGPAGYARFGISFMDPPPASRNFHWSVLFNPTLYPTSNLARVTRTGTCSWTIYADAGAKAGLRAWGVLRGKNSDSDEGLFSMPFGIDFAAPNCGA